MIKEIKNIRERSEGAKFLRLGYKKKQLAYRKKNRGPKTATRQIIGATSAAPAAPLPTPMHKQIFLCLYECNLINFSVTH